MHQHIFLKAFLSDSITQNQGECLDLSSGDLSVGLYLFLWVPLMQHLKDPPVIDDSVLHSTDTNEKRPCKTEMFLKWINARAGYLPLGGILTL